jgi:hypothetical protein
MDEHRIRSRLEPGARRQFFCLLIAIVWPIVVLALIVIWMWR